MLKWLKLLVRRFIKKRFSLIEKNQNSEIDIIKTLGSVVQIVSTTETFAAIQDAIERNEKGAYLRFGDGDVFLLNGQNEALQRINRNLQLEMIDAFKVKGKGIYKALSLHSEIFGFENGMFDGNHLLPNSYAMKLLHSVYFYFVGQRIYSPVALHFVAATRPKIANQFLRILKSNSGLLIANERTTKKTRKLLFGNIPFIEAPPQNSYGEIDRIYNEAKKELCKFNEYHVVVVAIGCSGRILIKRLLKENYNVFFFDFGSLLDGFDGNDTRKWLNLSSIDYQILTEDL